MVERNEEREWGRQEKKGEEERGGEGGGKEHDQEPIQDIKDKANYKIYSTNLEILHLNSSVLNFSVYHDPELFLAPRHNDK